MTLWRAEMGHPADAMPRRNCSDIRVRLAQLIRSPPAFDLLERGFQDGDLNLVRLRSGAGQRTREIYKTNLQCGVANIAEHDGFVEAYPTRLTEDLAWCAFALVFRLGSALRQTTIAHL